MGCVNPLEGTSIEIHGRTEDSLIRLSEIFNHTSIKVTKRYLGIRQKGIDDIFDKM